ncbi:MAG: FMN-binding protein [Faecalibacterium prausnitzii]
MSEKISRRNFLRTATLGAAAAGLLAGCGSASSSAAAGTYTAGTYSATATGINTATPVTVTMTFSADAITDVQIDVANETKGYGADIADEMVKKILDAQSSEVDGHSGATITSDAIRKAAESCINQAKGVAVAPTEANKAETVVPDGLSVEEVESSVCELGDITPDETKDFDVVVVGAGAAGVPQQAGQPSWAAMWLCCRSRASWSARATAVPPSSSPSPPTRARRCGCT